MVRSRRSGKRCPRSIHALSTASRTAEVTRSVSCSQHARRHRALALRDSRRDQRRRLLCGRGGLQHGRRRDQGRRPSGDGRLQPACVRAHARHQAVGVCPAGRRRADEPCGRVQRDDLAPAVARRRHRRRLVTRRRARHLRHDPTTRRARFGRLGRLALPTSPPVCPDCARVERFGHAVHKPFLRSRDA
eukprot:3864348-Prymnesium_polylepis.1